MLILAVLISAAVAAGVLLFVLMVRSNDTVHGMSGLAALVFGAMLAAAYGILDHLGA